MAFDALWPTAERHLAGFGLLVQTRVFDDIGGTVGGWIKPAHHIGQLAMRLNGQIAAFTATHQAGVPAGFDAGNAFGGGFDQVGQHFAIAFLGSPVGPIRALAGVADGDGC